MFTLFWHGIVGEVKASARLAEVMRSFLLVIWNGLSPLIYFIVKNLNKNTNFFQTQHVETFIVYSNKYKNCCITSTNVGQSLMKLSTVSQNSPNFCYRLDEKPKIVTSITKLVEISQI